MSNQELANNLETVNDQMRKDGKLLENVIRHISAIEDNAPMELGDELWAIRSQVIAIHQSQEEIKQLLDSLYAEVDPLSDG